MSRLLVDFANTSYWENIYSETRQAQLATTLGGHYPIPVFEIPFLIEKNILAIRCLSGKVKPTWRFSGYLCQRISIGITGGSNPVPTELGNYRLKLNRTSIVVFPILSENYELRFETFPWIQDMNIEIWQYTGSQPDSTELLIQQVRNTNLVNIETKIDTILNSL
jgi:hypothetical protein